ncbi:WXG100 family type VII secretion target [Streptomyces sioyaensis]|uniref:WXG100 family type VII secretion target n=1 Tax=Streptomyces sioyaensis TaxID=67364 RepID=A0A4Q1QM74_9ACTN|nr:WXG100 family type VII secretion target [Streptomyces sioyaensis]MBM4793161.1 WXG100 family type VII secretion target [Streptomyces sioyaensis]RXS60159.1 WXG100 family type VII secretion target [Streptomyces sioyaensis]
MSERRNPEALHEAAAGWREMGQHLDGLVRDLDRKVGTAAAANWQGPAGEAFAAEWHRLRRSVDESLPAFELAAADLETAAAASPDDKDGTAGGDGTGHGAPPVDHAAGGAQSSSGNETAYGFMALGQLANGLGGAFGKRGGGGGRRQGPAAGHAWDTSTAPLGPDPFGPARDGEAKTRGGEGLAKGVRSRPAGAEPAPGGERSPKAGAAEKNGAAAAPAGAAKDRSASAAEPPGPAGPDVTQHGAFG